MDLHDFPSPRITAIDLPGIDLESQDLVLIRAELDEAPIGAWLDRFQAVLACSSNQLRRAAPRLIENRIEFDSAPGDARVLCDELHMVIGQVAQQPSTGS